MCTVNIKIDNEKVRRINPNLKSNEIIERWAQYCMDEFIDTLSSSEHKSVSPNAHSASEMREILQERIHRAEAGEEKLISNTDVFAQIDKRYGFYCNRSAHKCENVCPCGKEYRPSPYLNVIT